LAAVRRRVLKKLNSTDLGFGTVIGGGAKSDWKKRSHQFPKWWVGG